MKRSLLLPAILLPFFSHAQSIITAWTRNTTGAKATYYSGSGMPIVYTFNVSTDSANVETVAYKTDSVWIRSDGLADTMGKYLNPGSCTAQNYVFRFPRTTIVSGTKTTSPKGGPIGLLLNGVPIYGLGDGNSWTGTTNANNGQGIWNKEVKYGEGVSLDTPYGAHPQQAGAYHSHIKPYKLYKNTPISQHSPLIGFAFDGNPVYGPYGYSSAMNAASAVSRMKTGYSLRNITTRTTLPTIPNGGATASQSGPAVSVTYPLGTFCEDYEWLASNGGDLDQYNGRTCVTPEYPSGTYAYFVTIDAAGNAAFPYYIGIQYYAMPVTADIPANGVTGLSVPAGAAIYTGGVPLPVGLIDFSGKAVNAVNELQWSFAGTEHLEQLALDRSDDGSNFSELATVLSTGKNVYTDSHPSSKNYYRLKMTSAGGAISYSSIVAILRQDKNTFHVYPTLVSNIVHITSSQQTDATRIVIKDNYGHQLINAVKQATVSDYTLNVSNLSPGFYVLQMQYNGNVESYKILKQ